VSLSLVELECPGPDLLALLRHDLAVLEHARRAELVVLKRHVDVSPDEVLRPEVRGPRRLPPCPGHHWEAGGNQLVDAEGVYTYVVQVVVAHADDPRPTEGDCLTASFLRPRRHLLFLVLMGRHLLVGDPFTELVVVDAFVPALACVFRDLVHSVSLFLNWPRLSLKGILQTR